MEFITQILIALLPGISFVALILLQIWSAPRRVFRVKELREYGGTIAYGGHIFEVERGARIDTKYSSVIVTNPNGESRIFTVPSGLSEQPVVTIMY